MTMTIRRRLTALLATLTLAPLSAVALTTPAQAAVVSRDCRTETSYNAGTVCLEVGRTGSTVDGLRICFTSGYFLGKDTGRGVYGLTLTVRRAGQQVWAMNVPGIGTECRVTPTNIANTLHGTATLSGVFDTVNRPDVSFALNSPF